MARTGELSRLLSFRRPRSTNLSIEEKVSNTIDLSNEVKRRSYSTSTPPWLKTPSFEEPEVDFAFIRKATRTEPIFNQRVDKIHNLLWKNGYVLKSEDQSALNYIKARTEIFTLITGQTFNYFLKKMSRELIKFDNVVLWERRLKPQDLKKLGITLPADAIGPNRKNGPVMFYEILPIETLRFKRDVNNNVIKWQQIGPGGQTKDYDPSEILVISRNEDSSEVLAYPRVWGVIPDTRILRQLETDASLVAHRLAFPIFKYKVGDPSLEQSIPKKEDDISSIWIELEGMLLDGTIIMPGTHDFDVVLSDVKMDGISAILDHFKNRVITGLGLSPVHLGDVGSANRSITDRLDIQLYDEVKAYQSIQAEPITFFIFGQWLIEGGFDLMLGTTNLSPSWVTFEWKEIDTDSLIKRENHAMTKWVQDGISHTELRSDLGLPATDDMSDFYSYKVGEVNAKFEKEVGQATAQASAGGSSSSGPSTKVTKTHSVETIDSYRDLAAVFRENAAPQPVLQKYQAEWNQLEYAMMQYVNNNHIDADNFDRFGDWTYGIDNIAKSLTAILRFDVLEAMRYGVDRGFDEAREIDPGVVPMRMSVFNKNSEVILRIANQDFGRLLSDLLDRLAEEIQNEVPLVAVQKSFAALGYRVNSIVSSHVVLAENWGVAIVAEHLEYAKVWQESESSCKVCYSRWIDTKDIAPKDVAPFNTHPNCGCKVHIREE